MIASIQLPSQISPVNKSLDAPAKEAPWVAGIRAARANFVPAVILQAFMLALLLAYYFHAPTTVWLEKLAELKTHWGYAYSALSALIAGAIIPEALRVIVFQKASIFRKNFSNLLFTIPFWGGMGCLVDAFYRTQAFVFGSEPTFQVVAIKVICDQLLYSPFIATPITCWLYDWKHANFRTNAIRHFFTASYVRDVMLPVIFANWGVWIPIVTILYSLPSSLQIPLFGLALSIWVMLLTWISERRNNNL